MCSIRCQNILFNCEGGNFFNTESHKVAKVVWEYPHDMMQATCISMSVDPGHVAEVRMNTKSAKKSSLYQVSRYSSS